MVSVLFLQKPDFWLGQAAISLVRPMAARGARRRSSHRHRGLFRFRQQLLAKAFLHGSILPGLLTKLEDEEILDLADCQAHRQDYSRLTGVLGNIRRLPESCRYHQLTPSTRPIAGA
jgi:hypothetical protein